MTEKLSNIHMRRCNEISFLDVQDNSEYVVDIPKRSYKTSKLHDMIVLFALPNHMNYAANRAEMLDIFYKMCYSINRIFC